MADGVAVSQAAGCAEGAGDGRRYLALLRGINVGGKNKVPMAELHAAFEGCGFRDVVTFIASGNVFFSADADDCALLRERCEAVVAAEFDVENPIMVLPAADVREAVAAAPDWWGSEPDCRHNAIFVLPPLNPCEVVTDVGATESCAEGERYAVVGQIIFWTIQNAHYNRSRMPKLIGSTHYRSLTIRNANTTKKLAELAAG